MIKTKIIDNKIVIETISEVPYEILITKAQYKKMRNIYSKRRRLIKIKPIEEIDNLLNLPPNMDWYEYNNRVFIFRRKHKIASLVITKNMIYNPWLACGGRYIFCNPILREKIAKTPLFISYLFYTKDYWKDMELLEKLEPNKDKITKMLKEYFDNSFVRFLEEYGIIDDKIEIDIN